MKGWGLLARNLTVVFGSWPSAVEQMCRDFSGNRWASAEDAGAPGRSASRNMSPAQVRQRPALAARRRGCGAKEVW